MIEIKLNNNRVLSGLTAILIWLANNIPEISRIEVGGLLDEEAVGKPDTTKFSKNNNGVSIGCGYLTDTGLLAVKVWIGTNEGHQEVFLQVRKREDLMVLKRKIDNLEIPNIIKQTISFMSAQPA